RHSTAHGHHAAGEPAYPGVAARPLLARDRPARGPAVLAGHTARDHARTSERPVRRRVSCAAPGRRGVECMSRRVVTVERYAAKRPWGHFAALLVVAVLVIGSFWAVEWDFSTFTDPAKAERALERASGLVEAFSSPDFSDDWLERCWELTKETLSAAVMATFLAVIFAYLLAMGAAKSVSVGVEPVSGWRG